MFSPIALHCITLYMYLKLGLLLSYDLSLKFLGSTVLGSTARTAFA